MTISEMADLATAIGMLFTVFGLILLAYQLSLQHKDQKRQAITRLFDEVATPEFRRKLLLVYSRNPDELVLSKLSPSEREMVEEVTAKFDGIGFRARIQQVPLHETLELFWDMVIRCAQQLRPHLLDQREKRGSMFEYKADFDWLARQSKLFQLRNLGHRLPESNLGLDELLKLEPLPIFRIEKP